MRFRTFPKDDNSKLIVIAWLECEVADYDFIVQHFSCYTTETWWIMELMDFENVLVRKNIIVGLVQIRYYDVVAQHVRKQAEETLLLEKRRIKSQNSITCTNDYIIWLYDKKIRLIALIKIIKPN